jgi:hypothetical protein
MDEAWRVERHVQVQRSHLPLLSRTRTRFCISRAIDEPAEWNQERRQAGRRGGRAQGCWRARCSESSRL